MSAAPARKTRQFIYTEQFYQTQSGDSEQSAFRIIPEVLTVISPRSVVDLGCGIGTWLKAFQAQGITDILGLDGSYVNKAQLRIDAERFLGCDLSQPVSLERTFDLAVSLEVAEHLPPERAESFVADICRLAPVALFSAAIPGQRGTNHVNERWQSYWASLFAANGFVAVEAFGRRFWENEEVSREYAQNMVLYAHEQELQRQPQLVDLSRIPGNRVLDVVHPHYWSNIGLSRIVTSLPHALSMAWNKRVNNS